MDITKAIQSACESTLKHCGQHAPTLLLQGSNSELSCHIDNFPENREQKLSTMFLFGFTVGESKAVGALQHILFISRGWLVDNSMETSPPVPDPSQDPRRKDVLIILSHKLEPNQTELTLFEILKYGEETPVDLIAINKPQAIGSHPNEEKIGSSLIDAFLEGFKAGNKK